MSAVIDLGGGDVMQLNTENGSSLLILGLVVNGSNSWMSENGSLSGEIAFGLIELEDEEAENGSRSMENVLAVGKCLSGSLWWIDKFLLELLKLELRVSMSDEVL